MFTINFADNKNVVRNDNIERYRMEINTHKPLSDDDMRNLIYEAQNGNIAARNRVVESNLRIVWSIAAHYNGMDSFEDILQNGNIGLCMAVDTFDVSRGTKFSTWALEQVRKQINIGLTDESRTIRMGAHLVKGKKAYHTASMDAPLANDEDGNEKTLLDTFASDMRTDNLTDVEDTKMKIKFLMRGLTDRERAIVCGLFGIGTAEVSEYTLSKKFGLTEERVRQIKWEALEKMKNL